MLAGTGALRLSPAASNAYPQSAAQKQARQAFDYGGGVNFALSKRVALRVEYRGLVYFAPDMGFSRLGTNSVTHLAQPSVGLSFRF